MMVNHHQQLLLLQLLATTTPTAAAAAAAAAANGPVTRGPPPPSPPSNKNLCNAEPSVGCRPSNPHGKDLATAAANSYSICCSFCKRTPNCSAWTWDSHTKQCHAKLDCANAVGELGSFSGSDHHLPQPVWPPGGPPVLPLPFRDASKPIAERVRWLVANLSNPEKLGLLNTRTSAIPRLAIKSYMYYVECNSGAYANGHYPDVIRGKTCSAENLTAFPQSPGMAATFNTSLERMKGDVIGRELRAIALAELDDFTKGPGLSCFSPMINIIRGARLISECPGYTAQS
jgi:hypothetical protein